MRAVYSGWIHVGPHSADVDTPVYLSITLVKAKPSHFEGKFQVPASGNWSIGAVVSYTDDKNWIAVLHFKDGTVQRFDATTNGNTWNMIGTAPTNSTEVFTVDQANGMANVAFNGTKLVVAAPSPRVGLAASDTTGRFTGVDWK
jgi:hypothetical protein